MRIRMKFYTVSGGTMTYNILLRRDFLNCPRLHVTFGETFEINSVKKVWTINQLMHIEYSDNSNYSGDELK